MPPGRPSRQARAAGTATDNALSAAAEVKEKPTLPIPTGPAPVAIDLGAFSVRITVGRNADTAITTRCPNAIVRQQAQARRAAGTNSSAWLIGPQIREQCSNFGSLSVRQPMDRGLVVDWAAQKAILDAALLNALALEEDQAEASSESQGSKGRLLEGRRVILTEAYFNLPDLQSAMDLLMMEEYGVAAIWRCSPALLIPYAPSLFKSLPETVRRGSRPECMLIVDLGHGASHTVPMVGEDIVWNAVRRHVISQRILTNLLKESISFRQWDMMDEAWLVGHIKEQTCFVAPRAGRRGDRIVLSEQAPSQWSFAALVEMCEGTSKVRNPIVQEYVLPDYSTAMKRSKYGFIRRGPGQSATTTKTKKGTRSLDDDAFIADMSILSSEVNRRPLIEDSEEEEDDPSDDDFDAEGAASGEEAELSAPRKKKAKTSKDVIAAVAATKQQDDDESEQVLVLERERFQIPEVMFNPSLVGLDDAPLHDVVFASIQACDDKNVQGMLWGNIVLVGGGAKMRGLKQRLYEELRSLAPSTTPVQIWTPEVDADMTAISGARAILTATQGSASHRIVKNRMLNVAEYTAHGSRERFGLWLQG